MTQSRALFNTCSRGFTLAEMMIANAVLVIAASSSLVAQEKLEALRGEYNRELEAETGSTDLTAGSHGPETMTLEAPVGSSMGDSEFEISWTVTIDGTRKTVNVTVEPQVSSELITDLSLTTTFVP